MGSRRLQLAPALLQIGGGRPRLAQRRHGDIATPVGAGTRQHGQDVTDSWYRCRCCAWDAFDPSVAMRGFFQQLVATLTVATFASMTASTDWHQGVE